MTVECYLRKVHRRVMKNGGYSVGWAGKWHHTTIAGGHVHEISKELGIDSYIEYSSSPKMYESAYQVILIGPIFIATGLKFIFVMLL